MSIEVSTAPATEPVTLTEAKAHMYIDTANDDTLVDSLILAARVHAENFTRRALITQTLKARYDYFSTWFELERGSIVSFTSLKYIDENGDEQTLSTDDYDTDLFSTPARITQAYGTTWPSTRADVPNVVILEYVAGYGDAGDVPQPIRQAMLMLIAHWYENREATISGTIIADVPIATDVLLRPYVVY